MSKLMSQLTSLLDLPDSTLLHVFSFLDAQATLRFGAVCHRTLAFSREDVLLWKPRCSGYGVSNLEGWNVPTFRELFLLLLKPFGHLLGAFVGELNPLGSCLLVYLDAPKIIGAVVSCLRFREACVSVVPVFSVQLEASNIAGEGRRASVHCLRAANTFSALTQRAFDLADPDTRQMEHHGGQLLPEGPVAGAFSGASQAFALSCSGGCKHHEVEAVCRWLPTGQVTLPERTAALAAGSSSIMAPGAPDFDIAAQFDLEVRGMHVAWTMQDIFLTGEASYRNNTPVQFRRLPAPPPSLSGPPHPLEGFWVGTYGPHGMEVLHISRTQDSEPTLVATKLTGDANVPAGEASFRIHPERPGSHAVKRGSRFMLPAGYSSRVDFPDLDAGAEFGSATSPSASASDRPASMTIVDSYEAQGQVAGTGYVGGRWIPAECVVLSGGLFGVMWIDLGSFSVFRKLPLPVFEPTVAH